jgi:hypothetical protein
MAHSIGFWESCLSVFSFGGDKMQEEDLMTCCILESSTSLKLRWYPHSGAVNAGSLLILHPDNGNVVASHRAHPSPSFAADVVNALRKFGNGSFEEKPKMKQAEAKDSLINENALLMLRFLRMYPSNVLSEFLKTSHNLLLYKRVTGIQ